ncbi:alpha/beta hydrolase [Pleurocapsales cyanobacterium LEGE 10410]|nr:alpha/beta hydrolase [Pleurocapsales cyanobacterium LEGE 10410]
MDTINIKEKSQSTPSEKLENALKNIYCVSGLGADERVFQKLKFQGYQPIHIRWIEPQKGENIADYAQRLTSQIKTEKPILIGLSFGGIIAMEIAKQIDTEKVILISSTKNWHEIPFYFKIFRWLPIYLLLPARLILWFGQLLASWFFSLETMAERKLFKAILFDTNARFLKWAIHQVVTWKNELIPQNVYHIHGESDRIFPFQFVREDFSVENGGHFMIMNRAEFVSNLIQKIVNLKLESADLTLNSDCK